MNYAIRFLCVVSIGYSVLSTMRCAGLQYKYMKSQNNVVEIARTSNSFIADYNNLLDTMRMLVDVDSTKDVETKIVTRTVTKTIYIRVPVTEQLPAKPAIRITRDSFTQPRRGSSEISTPDSYYVNKVPN